MSKKKRRLIPPTDKPKKQKDRLLPKYNNHSPYPDGYVLYKGVALTGNDIEGYRLWANRGRPITDIIFKERLQALDFIDIVVNLKRILGSYPDLLGPKTTKKISRYFLTS